MKEKLKKIWDFLWKSNSVWSWIVDIILVFLIVKFIIFPCFSLIFSTKLPFVIIESGSMEHKIIGYGTQPNICGLYFDKAQVISNFSDYWKFCGSWYEKHNITKAEFEGWSFTKGMNKGDIIIVKGLRDYSYKKGEIIIFRRDKQHKTPIIHRIVNIKEIDGELIFSTKGDHNADQLDYEKEITKEQIVGKAIARVPKLGWVKLFFVELFR